MTSEIGSFAIGIDSIGGDGTIDTTLPTYPGSTIVYDVEPDLSLITAWFRNRPKFAATVEALIAPALALESFNDSLTTAFDLDTAIGVQLDKIGEWVGRSRRIETPITGVYFSFDIDGLGFDEGYWLGQFDPTEGVSLLDDTTYRLLLRAKIASNQWDGTLGGADTALAEFTAQTGILIYLQDNQDMTMVFGIAGNIPDAITRIILFGGYIPLKPEGVRVIYLITTVNATPLFGFDAENSHVSGFDVGSWGGLS